MDKVKTTYQQLIGSLPAFENPFSDEELRTKIAESFDAIIVLDDDPTGTQTVHDIPVLTEWSLAAIGEELERRTPMFFILTNSRSLVAEKAYDLGLEIATVIKQCAAARNKKCLVVSRSDSTLRGHYPLEINTLIQVSQSASAVHFIVPAFFEGGRYTINDIHYVREGEQLIPAAETPFAQDRVFGFRSSHLKDWVIEKFDGKIDPSKIHSLSIADLEQLPIPQLISKINSLKANDVCIINAVSYNHLKQALYAVFSSDVDPFFRTAASLAAAMAGQTPKFIDASNFSLDTNKGGLTVLGSYVPKSTSQLAHVLENVDIVPIEIDVQSLLNGTGASTKAMAEQIDECILHGKNVILYTSRKLISSEASSQNLAIGSTVSDYLTTIVSELTVTPRYVIGKGGITSSDLATKSLKIKRALVLGQMIPGVPVWQATEHSKFPNTPFIVFPGNVGDHSGLTQVIQKLNP